MEEPDYLKDRFEEEQPTADRISQIRAESALERGMPHSTDAERALLGFAITSEICLLQAIELLQPDDFYLPSHRKIYQAMIALFERGSKIDPILINNELKKDGGSEIDVSTIASLLAGLPYTTNIEEYATVISNKAKLRSLIKAANKITQEVLEEEEEADVILGHAETQIYQLTETRYKTQLESINYVVEEVIDSAHSNIGVGLSVTGLRTGFIELDRITTGLQRSDLILLAARPSVGKTSQAVSIIVNTALNYDNTVAFFSLEMSKAAIAARMICNVARVDFQRFRQGFMNHQEWDAVENARNRLSVNRIFVDDKPSIAILEARAKLRRLEKMLGKLPDLIVFDYLQLMTGLKEHRRESRQQEVSGVSAGLKALAKELDRPVLALSQLKRGLESRSDKRPQLHDLRESGTLEQDSDVVIFIDRYEQDGDTYYEQIVAKNRNGPTDNFGLAFNGPAMRFDNLA